MAKKDDMVETGRDWKQRGRVYSISWKTKIIGRNRQVIHN